jgi:hypothetical protein
MEVPNFLQQTPTLDRKWLKGVITEQVSSNQPGSKHRSPRNRHKIKTTPTELCSVGRGKD